ncbi:lytic transglycosylase domain-containing protein [Calidifontibacter terrae]
MKSLAALFAGLMFLVVLFSAMGGQSAHTTLAAQNQCGDVAVAVSPVTVSPADATLPGDPTSSSSPAGFPLPAPGTPRKDSIGRPAASIPADWQAAYQRAGAKYGLPWTLLAGIGMEETEQGRNIHASVAGAQGPMQFMPATWASVGVDGDGDGKTDILSVPDAIFTAAHYLVLSGASKGTAGVRKAVYAYNHADWYVNDVLYYAQQYGGGTVSGGDDCTVGQGDGSAAALQATVRAWAYPTGVDGRLTPKPGYAAAIATAKSSGGFYGYFPGEIPAGRPDGIHCSAFVSLVMTVSGWDTNYNHGGRQAEGAGFVPTQLAWMQQHWQFLGYGNQLSKSQLRPGDVGISNNFALTHVWLFIGSVPGLQGDYAEASYAYGSSMGFAPQARSSAGVLYASNGGAMYFRRK